MDGAMGNTSTLTTTIFFIAVLVEEPTSKTAPQILSKDNPAIVVTIPQQLPLQLPKLPQQLKPERHVLESPGMEEETDNTSTLMTDILFTTV